MTPKNFPGHPNNPIITYLDDMGITNKVCEQFLHEQKNGVYYKSHTYTSDGQVWILYDTEQDVHENFRVGSTDHDGKILRDIYKIDISELLAYIRNKKIESIID